MDTKVYGVSITTYRQYPDCLKTTDESILENVFLSAETAEEYGSKVFKERIKGLHNQETRTTKHGCKYIDPVTGVKYLIHYEVFSLNLIKS